MSFESSDLKKARALIAETRGQTLSPHEREERAVTLAALLINESRRCMTKEEKKQQELLAGMLSDPSAKVFATRLTDQCFRSSDPSRSVNQMIFLLERYGIPRFLPVDYRLALSVFKLLGKFFPRLFAYRAKQMIRKETARVIIPGEDIELRQHILRRKREGVRVNLNHLGEAILGENEALRRVKLYLEDLAVPEVNYISIKISTICSQLHLISWDETVAVLCERLRRIYRAALENQYQTSDGRRAPKFVNLDMEEYRDMDLTCAAFCSVLDEKEFLQLPAGIVLQAYLPDAFALQKKLTSWAKKRVENGGAPIKIRLVKGANLQAERVDSSVQGLALASYCKKEEVDANFKKMMIYSMEGEHASAAHIGIASHNIFDIAYALLMRAEKKLENEIEFEMLEGMADHLRRAVQAVSKDMLLYCPTATDKEFVNAVAYLVRRLDENTAPKNFLRSAFDLVPGSKNWKEQVERFKQSCQKEEVYSGSFRQQNRYNRPTALKMCHAFENEPDTDWTREENRKWARELIANWKDKQFCDVPSVIDGAVHGPGEKVGHGFDPSRPEKPLYHYTLASEKEVDSALGSARAAVPKWAACSLKEKRRLLSDVALLLRERRSELIAVMIADGGKTVTQADTEVSEAIDFAEYYARCMEEYAFFKDLSIKEKGVVLVAPPWNFPCAIAAGGVLAALAAGNTVILKPAPEAVLVSWHLVNIFWEAGIDRHVLQFLTCEDDPVASRLVCDPRLDSVILTGATETAKHLLSLRPGLDLHAETGGKNAIIVTSLADRDLSIRDVVASAFGHAGQKCSACSLLILEAEVYDDGHYLETLCDAVNSLKVGSAWELSTQLNPLIKPPGHPLKRALTTLEDGEQWLLKSQQHGGNAHLWSPAIRLHVKEGSFTHLNEFFGPHLSVMRADDLDHAIHLANATPYGLTSGIHTLDLREQLYWSSRIQAGNLYINRSITGAIVQRQPFGGFKASSYGLGQKAGGPNYVLQLCRIDQQSDPQELEAVDRLVGRLNRAALKAIKDKEEQKRWQAAICSYAFYWQHYFSQDHDPSKLIGQDNLLRYLPREAMFLRVRQHDALLDVYRSLAAALTCCTPLTVSVEDISHFRRIFSSFKQLKFVQQTEDELISAVASGSVARLRLLSPASEQLRAACGDALTTLIQEPVLSNGRIELLYYLREVSISFNYHRYGNLGQRESEERSSLRSSSEVACCGKASCPSFTDGD